LIPPFDPETGALPPGDHQANFGEIAKRLGFTPRRRWLLKGLHAAVEAFWTAGIEEVYIDGSFCTEKPDPGQFFRHDREGRPRGVISSDQVGTR